MNQAHNLQLQILIAQIGPDRKPYVETGRKFDKVYVNGKVTFFVARHSIVGRFVEGDIFGAKSKLAPNFKWQFGNLKNIDKWDWSGPIPVNVSDTEFTVVKTYGIHIHYARVRTT